MIKRKPSCEDIYESALLPVDQALCKILTSLPLIDDYEIINLEQAKARTLAETISAPFNVPQHDNSAVDGYALMSSDIPVKGKKSLTVIDTAYAGIPSSTQIKPDLCIRIMTGALIPEGADTVIMQEHVEKDQQSIDIDHRHKPEQNIRLAGEDIQQGEVILQPGRLLTPADIGMMASLGLAEIKVKRKLRVAIASTGNEVINIGDIYKPGTIYDSNRYSLSSALDRPDIDITNLGILEDNPESLLNSFNQIGNHVDMIISTGGVSVGDADHTKTALEQSGQVDFWKIAIKPGRPLAFGHIGESVFFGLPGNPVAVLVTFYQFVLPAIEAMIAMTDKPIAPKIQARTVEDIRKKTGRMEIVRSIVQQDESGNWTVKTTGKQGSGILRSMSIANSFIILEHERESIKAGEMVTVQPFTGLF